MATVNSAWLESSSRLVQASLADRGWSVTTPLTPIRGRDADIDRISHQLDQESVRLVTLTGPGGIGKSRLAREVALRMQSQYAHGACFVPFAAVRDPTLIPTAVADALGLALVSDRPVDELVVNVLRDRHALVVLDNLEHLVDAAAAWVASLLEQCPRVSMLTTSRAPLRIAGEWRHVVEPLALPEAAVGDDRTPLTDSAAVTLFAERAQAVDPSFQLTPENSGDVVRICRMLDGLPLAIELAAVQVRLKPPRDVLGHLGRRLTDLHTDRRDAPPRHHTMRAAIAWGYDLLDPSTQRLFRWLSIFAGGFSLAGAEAIGDIAVLTEVPDRMLELFDLSIIGRRDGGPDGYRFTMLEVVREFGVEELESTGELEPARDAHAAWNLRLARGAEPHLYRQEQVTWLDRLDLEHDNIRRAVAWLIDREQIDEAMDLTGSLWYFRWLRGYDAEARDQLARLLAHPRGQHRTVARGKALHGLGIIMNRQGDLPGSVEALDEAIEIFREHDAQRWLGLALLRLGVSHIYGGRTVDGEASISASLEIGKSIGDSWLIQAAQGNLGVVALDRGKYEQARKHQDASVRASRSVGDRLGLALGLVRLGKLDEHAGELDAAEEGYREAARLIEELGDRRDLPVAYCALADIARHRGSLDEARVMLNKAYELTREMSDHRWAPSTLEGLARVAGLEGDHRSAVDLLREAMHVFERAGDLGSAVLCLDSVADMALALGDAVHAAWCIGVVDGTLRRSGRVRRETAPGEHTARVDAVIEMLGASRYDQYYSLGKVLDDDAVLREAAAWSPPEHAPARGRAEKPSTLPPGVEELSERELEVLRLMADGLTNQGIADALFVSHRTATSHTSNILSKLGLATRTAAVAYAIRNGLA